MHKVNQMVFRLKNYKKAKKDVYADIIEQIKCLINNGEVCVIFKDDATNSIALDFMSTEENSSDPLPYYLTKDEAMVVEDYIKEKEATQLEEQLMDDLVEHASNPEDRRA